MKPIKIEPSDIRVTFEASASELQLLDEYLELSESLINNIYGNTEQAVEARKFVHGEFKEIIGQMIKAAGIMRDGP